MPRGLHEGLLSGLRVVPDLGREAQDAHRVPRVDLGLAQGPQGNLAHLAVEVKVNVPAEFAEAAVLSRRGGAVVVAVLPALVFLVLVLLVFFEARVAEVVESVGIRAGGVAMMAGHGRTGRRAPAARISAKKKVISTHCRIGAIYFLTLVIDRCSSWWDIQVRESLSFWTMSSLKKLLLI